MSEPEQPAASPHEGLRWLQKAEDDLTVATLVVESDSGARWAACFHAQHAAEKALKAFLVTCGIDFPFTHSLDRLADQADRDVAGADRSILADLTPWAVAGRYPEDVPEPTADETRRLVDGATSIVAAVRNHAERVSQPRND